MKKYEDEALQAIKTISAICEKNISCSECPFYSLTNMNEDCFFLIHGSETMPYEWERNYIDARGDE